MCHQAIAKAETKSQMQNGSMKKSLIVFSILVIVLFIFLEIVFTHVVPYAIIQPFRSNEALHPGELDLSYLDLEVQTDDSLTLKGYWIASEWNTSSAVVILLHGIGGCKEHFLGVSAQLAQRGYESVALDLRAHGQSEGQFTTYGYREKYDVKAIIDHIRRKNDSIPIGIWGHSLGGAIALQAMALDDRISFGIVESTFRDLKEIMLDYQKRLTKIPLTYFMRKAIKKSEDIANYRVNEVKPIESVPDIKHPVLIAHGNKDRHISYHYGQQLYENLGGVNNEWVLIDGGEHHGLQKTGGEDYQDRLYAFLSKQVMRESAM